MQVEGLQYFSLKDQPRAEGGRISNDVPQKLHSITRKMRKITLCLNENCIKSDKSKLPKNIQLLFHISSLSPFSKLSTQVCYVAYLQSKR